ncbi:FAD-dependent oxidoreductase [Streptomyces parvulus]|uniref:FAD-dependent oxidoreductase n=1 Tax=Streptomyces parvulus TaxID=146923 RepID=UPI00369AA69C
MIGTSQGGRFLPIDLAGAGKRVALVERDHLGGVRVNTGCTPTKTMVAGARVAQLARRAAEYGVRAGPVSVDLAAVRERKAATVAGARENQVSRLAQDGLDLIEGQAGFTGPKSVEVAMEDGGTRTLGAPVIIVDAGARSRPLTLDGARDVPVLDSTSIMELEESPEHLIILGGGHIGLEFGQMFRRFGSEVTIVQTRPRLLMAEDDDISDAVADILRDDGIAVLTSAQPERVEGAGGGRLRLPLGTVEGERWIEGSHLLSAIGRVPDTEALAPDAAGIRLDDRGFIEVDAYLETSVPGVYAMGDVKGGPAFTHLSYDDYRILFDPQFGRVGISERQSTEQNRAVRIAKLPMGAVVRAIEAGERRGFMKAVVDADTRQILGAAVLGAEGGEITSVIQVAMLGKLTVDDMANAVFTHPLLAEGLNSLFGTVNE